MPPSSTSTAHPLSVLIADDSLVARAALVRKLTARGFDVAEHESVDPPDPAVVTKISCAVLDLDLGDGDGRELARALRTSRPDLPIAFFSASSAAGHLDDARSLGPVFTKPAQLDDAAAWVEQVATKRV